MEVIGLHRFCVISNEFPVSGFLALCNQHHITIRKINSYNPTSSGKIERKNREMRKLLSALFIRNNNTIWVPFLQDLVSNINNQVSSVYPYSANEIFTPQYNPPNGPPLQREPILTDDTNNNERQEAMRFAHIKRAKKIVSSGRLIPSFNVGDNVNVSMLVYSSLQRKARKGSISTYNKVGIHHIPQILQISRVYRQPPGATLRDQYELVNNAGVHVMAGIVRKRFFGNQLTRVENPSVPSSIQPATMFRVEELNKLR